MDKKAVALILFLFLAFAASVQATSKQTEVQVDLINGDAAYLTVQDQAKLEQISKKLEEWKEDRRVADEQRAQMQLLYFKLLQIQAQQVHFTGEDMFRSGMPSTESVTTQVGIAKALFESAQEGVEIANKEIAYYQKEYEQVLSKASAETVIPKVATLTSVTEASMGYIIKAKVNSHLAITSGGNSVLLHPNSEVFMVVNKHDGAWLVDVLQGTADFNMQATGTIILVQKSIVDYQHTSFSVTAKDNGFTVSAYEGDLSVWGFDTKNNYSLPMDLPTFQAEFDSNGTSEGAKPTVDAEALKVIATKPDSGRNISSIRPIVGLFFNKPIGSINESTILLNAAGSTVSGQVFKSGINKLEFIPDGPLAKGTYVLSASGVQDNAGAKMEPHSSNFTIQCSQPDAQYVLSEPRLYNFTKTFYFRNLGPETMNDFNFTLSLLRNDTNTFAWLKSFSTPPQSQSKDAAGNLYATWLPGQLKKGESLNVSVNYLVFSVGIDYFSTLSLSGNESPKAGEYTKSSQNIESTDSRIRSIALQNTKGPGPAGALGLYDWVRRNIRYDYSLSQSEGALPTLGNGTGVCFGYATLYAALARAALIPTKYVSGWALWQDNETTADGHAWDKVYIDGRWLPVDATWATGVSDYFAVADNRHIAEYEGVGTKSGEGYHYTYRDADPGYETNTSISYQVLDPSLLSASGEFFSQLQYALLVAQYKNELETRLGWLGQRKSWCDEYDGAAVSANALSLYASGKENESVALLKAYTGPTLNLLAAGAGEYADSQLKTRKDLEDMGWHFQSDTGRPELLAAKGYLSAASNATATGNYSAALQYSRLALDVISSSTIYMPPSIVTILNESQFYDADLNTGQLMNASQFNDTNMSELALSYLQTVQAGGNKPAADVDTVTVVLVLAALVAVPLILLALFAFWVWMLWDCLCRKEFARFGRLSWVLIIVLGSAIGALVYFFVERNAERQGTAKKAAKKG